MECCELCALPLAADHPHLFERQRRTIICACDACATLFDLIDTRRYRRIRPSVRRLAGMEVAAATWSALGVPVGVAFLSPVPGGDVLAGYPGPAGTTVARIDRAAWDAVVGRHPELLDLEPDVEAWLVNRTLADPSYYRVSIDHCYRLAGIVRSRWQGVGGGADVTQAVADFFRTLEAQAV